MASLLTTAEVAGLLAVSRRSTNRISATGASYDNNGNQTAGFGGLGFSYDAANRVAAVTGGQGPWYAYDSDNRRIYYRDASGTETIYLYGADGKKQAAYTVGFTKVVQGQINQGYTMQLTCQSQNVYFAGRLLRAEGQGVATDRLGSVRSGGPGGLGYQAQYPYGVEYTLTVNDREKYATYTRDSLTGLDYAVNRYYSSQWGRFLSPDPYVNSAGLEDPGSWNRYAYTRNDPVNRFDPDGTCDTSSDGPYSVTVCAGLDPVTLSGAGVGYRSSRPTYAPADPLGYTVRQAYALAMGYRVAVRLKLLTDCQALAGFAQDVADQSTSTKQFVNDFGVLTPKGGSSIAGIAWNVDAVKLNTGQASGYLDRYQNTLPDNSKTGWNGDQGHHFAAFFQFGYKWGANAGAVLSFAMEYWQGLDSGVMNTGDVALGEAAAQIGADLKAGNISMGDVVSTIRDTICSH